MKLNQKLLIPFFRTVLILGLPAFAVRIFVYWKELDAASGFFTDGGTACLLYNVLGFAVFFLALIFSFSKKGESVEVISEEAPIDEEAEEILIEEALDPDLAEENRSDALPRFSARCAMWHGTLSAFASFLPGFGFLAYALSFFALEQNGFDLFQKALLFFSVLSGAYFLLSAFFNSAKSSRLRAFAALTPTLWCTIRLVVEYRDLARFVNKSLYIGQFLFIISCLVFFLYQAQILLGDRALIKPNSYLFTAIPPIFFGLTARLPQLVAILGDRMKPDLVDASTLLMDLALSIFIAVKFRSILQEN